MLNFVVNGFTKVNGQRVIKVVMVFERLSYRLLNMRALGPMDYKMAMDRKPMLILELIKVNGFVVCDMVMVFVNRRLMAIQMLPKR